MDDSQRDESISRAREFLRLEAYSEAEALLSHLIQEIESQFGEEATELITPLYLYAKSVSKQHPWNTFVPDARVALERALRLAVGLYGEESARTKRLHEALAVCLHAAGETGLAATHMAVVVRLAEHAHGNGVLLAHALTGMADMLLDLKRFEEALSTYTRAFNMAGDRGDELQDSMILYGQGRCLIGMGRHADAIPILERAHTWFLSRSRSSRMAQELQGLLACARREVADEHAR